MCSISRAQSGPVPAPPEIVHISSLMLVKAPSGRRCLPGYLLLETLKTLRRGKTDAATRAEEPGWPAVEVEA